jgi:hypothetical protein
VTVLRVRTHHSDYVIDTEGQRFSRQTRHEDANPIPSLSTGEMVPFARIRPPEVGESLLLILTDGRWLHSTPVESVEEVEAAA